MKYAYLLSAAVLLGIAGCQTWKAAPRKPDARVCGDTAASVPHLTWTPATDMPVMREPLPASYRVYVVPHEEANVFFTAVGKGEALTVSVPLPGGCTVFRIPTGDPLSDAAKEKTPNRISVKGTAPGGELRLDWDGTAFRGQAVVNGTTHLIQPRSTNGKTWYLIYDARSASPARIPAEQRATTPIFDR